MIGSDRGVLHEVNDQLDTIRPVTKWAQRILDPRDVPEAVHEAFYQLKSGRPRPVEIEIPPETLADVAEIELLEPVNYQRQAASADSIQEGARIVANAKNPLIYAGGGVNLSGANDALLALAEYLQAPVIETAEGKGAISDRHYLSLGVPRRVDPYHDRMTEHDVILAVGTRIQTPQILQRSEGCADRHRRSRAWAQLREYLRHCGRRQDDARRVAESGLCHQARN